MEQALTTIAFCKPFRVLSQFSAEGEKLALGHYLTIPEVYPAGRLDYDSEGLLLLTDNGRLQHQISSPRHKWPKLYWVQVEGEIDEAALQALRQGLPLKDGPTRPAEAWRIDEPDVWPRQPPIRERKSIPTSWIALSLREGRNRQVRRMTAAVGFPTLRLIRAQIGPIALAGLQPGQWRELDETDPQGLGMIQAPKQGSIRPAPAPSDSRQGRRHPRKPSHRSQSSGPRKTR